MELHCLQPSRLSSIPRTGWLLLDKPILRGPTILKCGKRTFQDRTRLKCLGCRAQASGVTSTKQVVQDATKSSGSPKDGSLVFVAGATGRVGSRTVRELLKLGFRVRAGVRSIQRAESLVQSVEKMKIEDVEGGTKATNKLELVECDLENWNQIGPALGNSSVVICCIGASEKEVFDVTGPYRIDYLATKNLIEAATSAKVDYFILLTSLGTNKFGFPAAILNLFWGVLCWKRRAEEALLASCLPYTIVRPGGMERPTDSYKETHNITLSEADTLFGGQVSNLQVAELMAFMAKTRSLSYCKVVEVIAETTAPLTPMGELLQNIPSQREEIVPSKKSGVADKPQPVVPDSTYTEKEPEKIKSPASRPQSPYTAYEDLKPPTSPTPTPSTGSGATKAGKIDITPVEVNSPETSTISIENVVPETAPKKTTPLSPYMNYEDLRPLTSPTPTPSTGSGTTEASKIEIIPAELNSSETSTISIDNVVPRTAPKKETPLSPLSPYTSYEDLMPPTSSTPTPSTSAVSTKGYDIDIKPTEESSALSVETSSSEKLSVVIEDATPPIAPKRKNALSPYINYEDLKPPSSPTPNSPSTIRAAATKAIASEIDPLTASSTSSPVEVNSSEESSVVIQNATVQCAPKRTYALSPCTAYEDLKPPSSPTPTPSGSQEKPSIVTDSTTAIPQFTGENDVASAPNGNPETPVDDKPGHVEHHVQPKARPLSPYTMYEELKPPTSPTPSSP